MQNTQVKKRSVGQFLLNYALYIILLAILVAVSIANPDFLQVNNIMQILKQASTRGILALGLRRPDRPGRHGPVHRPSAGPVRRGLRLAGAAGHLRLPLLSADD